MAINQKKHDLALAPLLRDIRPLSVRTGDYLTEPNYSALSFVFLAVLIYMSDWGLIFADLIALIGLLFFWWLSHRSRAIAFKLPLGAPYKDPHNKGPGRNGTPEGILYLGNADKTNEEVWFTNSDARTHILYLGTTGSGKTEGLKSMVSNAVSWGSGFVYVDGKADTDLWSSLSALVRRFGRDDDLLVLNYMTGNSDIKSPSNTMNPFSNGSASYLVNMLVSLMPESEGDNAMWKERAVSLAAAMMPILTWKRDNQDIPMSVRTIRDNLSLNNIVKLRRDEAVPEKIRDGLGGYLDTLPGFEPSAYDDQGEIKPPEGGPPPDTTTANQQHGYLAMQFTRSLQSLGDDYGYIFDTQAADVDMVDVVLNRRILVVLIPALEKSGDEIANLGKIIAATMKGMMGSTLGANVEGTSSTVIENKPTNSATPFMTVFDEVGYYTAEGMAVMAAQARSLGFCLVFSGQDLPAMKKRVREEANSITANCNIKIFGKLEDPTETKEFFEKTVGTALVLEVTGFQSAAGSHTYTDTHQAGIKERARATYDALRGFQEGEAIITFGEGVTQCKVFYSNPGHAKAMRVTRFMALPPPSDEEIKYAGEIGKLRDLMVNKSWTAKRADVAVETPPEIEALVEGFKIGEKTNDLVQAGITAVVQVHVINNTLEPKASPSLAADPASTPASAKENSTTPTDAGEAVQEKISNTEYKSADKDTTSWNEIIEKATGESVSAPIPPTESTAPTQETETGTEAGTGAKAEPTTPEEAPAIKDSDAIELPDDIKEIVESAGKDAKDKLFKETDNGE